MLACVTSIPSCCFSVLHSPCFILQLILIKMRGAACFSADVPVLFMHACEIAGNWDLEDYTIHTCQYIIHIMDTCNRIKLIIMASHMCNCAYLTYTHMPYMHTHAKGYKQKVLVVQYICYRVVQFSVYVYMFQMHQHLFIYTTNKETTNLPVKLSKFFPRSYI